MTLRHHSTETNPRTGNFDLYLREKTLLVPNVSAAA
jgi:hypothetical protein